MKFKTKNGFTLLELLVSALILSAVLSIFFGVSVSSLRSFEAAKQRYLAAKIAQEGMELAVNKRDNNRLCIDSGCPHITNWQEKLIGSFEVDATETNRLLANQTFKVYDPTNYLCLIDSGPIAGMFSYCGNPNKYIYGNFRREVNISAIDGDKILVKSRVDWETRGTLKSLILEEMLFGP